MQFAHIPTWGDLERVSEEWNTSPRAVFEVHEWVTSSFDGFEKLPAACLGVEPKVARILVDNDWAVNSEEPIWCKRMLRSGCAPSGLQTKEITW